MMSIITNPLHFDEELKKKIDRKESLKKRLEIIFFFILLFEIILFQTLIIIEVFVMSLYKVTKMVNLLFPINKRARSIN